MMNKEGHMTKSEIMRDFVLSQLGAPYVFGARGQPCTPEYRGGLSAALKKEHPTIVSKCQVLSGRKATCEGCSFYGKRCYDCRGLTYCAAKEAGLRLNGAGCTSQWGDPQNWEKQGPINEMPANLPCIVMRQNGKTMEHTAYYLGDGTTVEASVNVKRRDVAAGRWTHYGTLKGQFEEGEAMSNEHPALTVGSKSDEVKEVQRILIELGYNLGVYGPNKDGIDGEFGNKTKDAVIDFQAKHNLAATGTVDEATWTALLDSETPEEGEPAPEDVYTVTIPIPNLTLAQADALLVAWPGSSKAVG
jgi:hypothetical protein